LLRGQVEIAEGEVTEFTLTPAPSTVTVLVTKDGQPQEGMRVYMVPTWRGGETTSGLTDAQGRVELESPSSGTSLILLEREYKAMPERSSLEARRRFEHRMLQMRLFQSQHLSIEMNSPEGVWVAVTAELPKGSECESILLRRRDGTYQGYSGVKDDEGRFVFPLIPVGQYSVYGTGRYGEDWGFGFVTELEVEQQATQTIELKPDVPVFIVELDVPPEVDMARVNLEVAALETWPYRRWTVRPRDDRRVPLIGLANGPYRFTARVVDNKDEVLYIGILEASLEGSGRVTLTINTNVGTIVAHVSGEPNLRRGHPRARITLTDEHGRTIQPEGQSHEYLGVGVDHTIPYVPAGRYTARVTAFGLQPKDVEVTVTRGEVTNLAVELETAAVLRLTVKGIDFEAFRTGEVTAIWQLEDADGVPITIPAPDNNLGTLEATPDGKGLVLTLINLTPQVRQVRTQIEGYEEIVVKVEVKPGVKPGDGIEHEVKAEPKE
jgi:hypothetical protein